MSELTKVDRCETCGYTKKDAQLWGDHGLCKNAGKAPWEKSSPVPEGPAQSLIGGFPIRLDATMSPNEAMLAGKTSIKLVNLAPAQPSPVVQTPESEVAKAERILWEIAKKINSLEGLPVDFGLTRRLSELLRGITESVNQPAPVVTDLAQRIRNILTEGERPHDGNPATYISWLQAKLLKIHKEVTQ